MGKLLEVGQKLYKAFSNYAILFVAPGAISAYLYMNKTQTADNPSNLEKSLQQMEDLIASDIADADLLSAKDPALAFQYYSRSLDMVQQLISRKKGGFSETRDYLEEKMIDLEVICALKGSELYDFNAPGHSIGPINPRSF